MTCLEDLLPIVNLAVSDAYLRGGSHLVCHPGCSQCCIGVFAIAQQDAQRLREGLASPRRSPLLPSPHASSDPSHV